jgi:mannose-6-phosphate isomerase-like protein (cupin superfamily)
MKPKNRMLLALIPGILALASFAAGIDGPGRGAASMLADFAASYEGKFGPAVETVFGVDVKGDGGGSWAIGIGPGRKVSVKAGKPDAPTFSIVCDLDTLRKIHGGQWNALTAAGKARDSDPSPLDIAFMEGFKPGPDTMEKVLHVLFHFFNTTSPEVVRFGEDNSRFVHGGNAVVFYYAKGLRTAWYQLKKGMVINAEEKDQTNPFPTLFICTRGEGRGRLGGREVSLKEGMSVFIPAGLAHTFWNEKDTPCEGIIIMFGEGA